MPRRKDSFSYGVTIPATSARVVDTALEILGDPDPGELAFLHSVVAQTFRPCGSSPACVWEQHEGGIASPRHAEKC